MISPTRKIAEIQGLRALAAILVLIFHAKFIPGGYIGVDIFYVISGFLITGLLLKEFRLYGGISLSKFYLRRVKRLLPAAFLVIFSTALFTWLFLPAISRGSIGRDLIATTLYISNYLFAWAQNDYQNLNATPSPFLHYWSLAVEEQFYLLWPLLLVAIAKFKAPRRFIYIFLTITISSFSLGLWLTQLLPIWAFYSLPTRAWELAIGATLAALPNFQIKSHFLSVLGFVGIILSAVIFSERTAFPGGFALLPVLGTFILIASVGHWPRPLARLANNRLTLWLGEISYPLYLWHWPVLVLPVALFSRELSQEERLLALFLTVVLAALTTKYIETPLRLRNFKNKTILSTLLLVMITSLLLGYGIIRSTTSAILIDGKQITLAKIEARPSPYENGCHLNYQESISPKCEFGKLDSKKVVVLYGDSHAVQWFPALEKLANEKGFKLISLTKSACPSIAVQRESVGAFKMSNCQSWRDLAISRIANLKPDLLILASFEHFLPSGDPKFVQQWWSAGSQLSYKTLTPLATTTIYIKDTPLPARNIPKCLATTKAENCFARADLGLVQVADFQIIDPQPWLCNPICSSIVRSNVAYRDASHLSVATARELSNQLWQALLDKGFRS